MKITLRQIETLVGAAVFLTLSPVIGRIIYLFINATLRTSTPPTNGMLDGTDAVATASGWLGFGLSFVAALWVIFWTAVVVLEANDKKKETCP